eukprot:7138856-Prymnesium_polylepis.1
MAQSATGSIGRFRALSQTDRVHVTSPRTSNPPSRQSLFRANGIQHKCFHLFRCPLFELVSPLFNSRGGRTWNHACDPQPAPLSYRHGRVAVGGRPGVLLGCCAAHPGAPRRLPPGVPRRRGARLRRVRLGRCRRRRHA